MVDGHRSIREGRRPFTVIHSYVEVAGHQQRKHDRLNDQEEGVSPPYEGAMIQRALRELRDIECLGIVHDVAASTSGERFSRAAGSPPRQNQPKRTNKASATPITNGIGWKITPDMVPATTSARRGGQIESVGNSWR